MEKMTFTYVFESVCNALFIKVETPLGAALTASKMTTKPETLRADLVKNIPEAKHLKIIYK